MTDNNDTIIILRLRSRTYFDAIVNWCNETFGYCHHQASVPYNNFYWSTEMKRHRFYEGIPIEFSFESELDAIEFKLRFSAYL
jgi:hypothetical protein